jgi:hypothetical protein
VLDTVRPVLEYEVTFALVVAIWLQGPAQDVACSTLNPVSLLELSVQLKSIWVDEIGAAVSEQGGEGRFAAAELPTARSATRARTATDKTYRHEQGALMRASPNGLQSSTGSLLGVT